MGRVSYNDGYENPNYETRKSFGSSACVRRTSTGRKLSLAEFNGLIGLVLAIGFGINVLLVTCCSQYFVDINPTVLIIGYLIVSIAGIVISKKSEDPFISFLGYLMVVVPVGIVLSVCLAGQSSVSIVNALAVTAGVTLVMLIASQIKPDFFLSLGRALGIALLAVIVIEVIMMLAGWARPTFWDYLIALIFCGYIGYDWAKAQEGPHTADGAVDACVGLYLDIVNLFLRILSIMGRRDD